MDKELQLIEHLYDEVSPDSLPLRELLEDTELASEYQALSRARFVMEHRARVRPPAAVVNAIVRGAATRQTGGARQDRPALRLVFLRRSMAGALALAAVIALTVMVSPWTFFDRGESAPSLADGAETRDAPAEVLQTLPPAAMPAVSAGASSLPEWDSGDDLRRLSRRIQSLQASGELQWDEPAVPLEMIPSGNTGGLRPAGSRR